MTRAEYDQIIADFLAEYNDWFEGEWPVFTVRVRCRTEGCVRNDDSIVEYAPVAYQLDGVYKAICAQCNKQVDDLNPELTDDPDFRLPTRFPDGSGWME